MRGVFLLLFLAFAVSSRELTVKLRDGANFTLNWEVKAENDFLANAGDFVTLDMDSFTFDIMCRLARNRRFYPVDCFNVVYICRTVLQLNLKNSTIVDEINRVLAANLDVKLARKMINCFPFGTEIFSETDEMFFRFLDVNLLKERLDYGGGITGFTRLNVWNLDRDFMFKILSRDTQRADPNNIFRFVMRWAYEKDISNPYANLVGIHRVIRWDLIDLRLLQYEALSFIVYNVFSREQYDHILRWRNGEVLPEEWVRVTSDERKLQWESEWRNALFSSWKAFRGPVQTNGDLRFGVFFGKDVKIIGILWCCSPSFVRDVLANPLITLEQMKALTWGYIFSTEDDSFRVLLREVCDEMEENLQLDSSASFRTQVETGLKWREVMAIRNMLGN